MLHSCDAMPSFIRFLQDLVRFGWSRLNLVNLGPSLFSARVCCDFMVSMWLEGRSFLIDFVCVVQHDFDAI